MIHHPRWPSRATLRAKFRRLVRPCRKDRLGCRRGGRSIAGCWLRRRCGASRLGWVNDDRNALRNSHGRAERVLANRLDYEPPFVPNLSHKPLLARTPHLLQFFQKPLQ